MSAPVYQDPDSMAVAYLASTGRLPTTSETYEVARLRELLSSTRAQADYAQSQLVAVHEILGRGHWKETPVEAARRLVDVAMRAFSTIEHMVAEIVRLTAKLEG